MSTLRGGWRGQIAIYLWLVSMLLPGLSFAQSENGVISGTVVDNSGAILSGAQIKLLSLGIVSVTNGQGAFTLPEVPFGKYTLAVSYVGFSPKREEVDLSTTQSLNINVVLDVSSLGEEVLVTAERPHGEAEAINQTRTADNIVQVLPSEVIRTLPNANVSDAIGRLPAVSLYRIEGGCLHPSPWNRASPHQRDSRRHLHSFTGAKCSPGSSRCPSLRSNRGRRAEQDSFSKPGCARHRRLGEPAHEGSR